MVIAISGKDGREAAKEFAFVDSELTMIDGHRWGRRDGWSGHRQTFERGKSCSVGEARWQFLALPE
jgi:hypothetical protein